jgi:peptidoglycan/LPS O-acetylase OafA/YrhL
LATGALLAIYRQTDPFMRWLRNWHFAAAALVWLLAHHLSVTLAAPTSILGLVHALLIIACTLGVAVAARGDAGSPLGRVLTLPPLVYLGLISYGVYLYHGLVPMLLLRLIEAGALPPSANWGWSALMLKGTMTMVMAMVSWHVIEKPIGALKHRFAYGGKPG